MVRGVRRMGYNRIILLENVMSMVYKNGMITDRRTFMAQASLLGGALAAAAVLGDEAPDNKKGLRALLVNGSPHREGCTYTALSLVAEELEKSGVEVEILHLGAGPMQDCIACGNCRRHPGVCIWKDDPVNELIDKAKNANGFVFGSPVYYGHPSGRLLCALDRAFYAGSFAFAGKPGAAVASSRRAGSLATIDAIQKHLTINQMPVVSSFYWNEVHGDSPEQVMQDAEGVAIMHQLGRNLARAIKAYAASPAVEEFPRSYTNFIR